MVISGSVFNSFLGFLEFLSRCVKKSKYGVLSGPYFSLFRLNPEIHSVFSPKTRKYGREKTPYLYTFHTGNL